MSADAPTTNQVGKRYTCDECGAVLMCVKPGAGRLTCHGTAMSLVSTKPLPSSD